MGAPVVVVAAPVVVLMLLVMALKWTTVLIALNYGYYRGFNVHDVAPCYLVAFRQRQQLQSELPSMVLVSAFTFLVLT